MTLLGNTHPFFRNTVDCRGQPSICPKVKFLMSLKLVCYGVSPAAFQDYFQMGISTAHECLKHFCSIVSQDGDLNLRYRRRMNRADARKLSDLHFFHHGVQGMVGSLDCMHVCWRLCPKAWHGAYQGSKGVPTIILEAVADYNLFLWHSMFSSPGSLNDINVWDRSQLLQEFIDGRFAREVDFLFEIAGEAFHQVSHLFCSIFIFIYLFLTFFFKFYFYLFYF